MDMSHVTDHSSSMSRWPDYEVFLSFRGAEMRRGFADFLYTMLTDVGIRVFRDEEEPERGKEILPQLIQVIEKCKISIPIISKEYASGKSCLMELEQMVECMDNKSRIIIPIFYYVDPSDVRDCRGPFKRALDEHKKRDGDASFLDHWMSALHRIGQLEGHHFHEKSELSPGKVVKRIVHQVQQKLKKEQLIVTKQLVGVDSHVQGIMAKLKVDYRDGQAVKIGDTRENVLGIYGISGVGKTVLAKYVYNQLHHLFDACSFLEIKEEIKDPDIVSVQNRLISHLDKRNAKKFDTSMEALFHIRKNFCTMKVLVLLDDVHDHEQLSALVGELDWLGPTSRVILTSQTQDVLRNINGAERFVLEPMKQDEALKLFCRHAFGTDSPCEEFKILSTDIVAATGWLPLALEVIGSSLFLVKSKKVWRETLTALEVAPHERVQAALEKSYANLDTNEQQIFLDIACFFVGMDKRIPYYMWDDCKYNPSKSIRALHARSLVVIGEDKKLLMHDILKKFGWEIVKNENQNEPCKRSRLCHHEEALHALERKEGTEKVEALGLEFGDGSKGNISFECDQFDGLQNLRFLKLDRADIRGKFGDRLLSLRWLDWQGCPEIFDVQSLDLNLQNLVVLNLSHSQVDNNWGGWKLLVVARRLKVLKLTGCVQLSATPEFPLSMELERLILEGCSKLAVIHPSFGNLTKLVYLNMKQCSLLYKLPDLGPMRDLKELVIDGTAITRIDFQEGSMGKLKTLSACDCNSLTEISDSIRYLKSLTYLSLNGSAIDTLQESIGSLEQLKTLSLKNCRRLSNLPDEIGKLRSLQLLDLSDTVIQKLPPSVKDLKDMKVLRMRGTSIRKFPEAILNLEKLEEIDFSLCRSLEGKIPDDIWRLSSLAILKLSQTQIFGLPASVSLLSRLRELDISRCDDRQSLPFSQKMDNSHDTNHSSSMSTWPHYDVFLSFCGQDTCKTFAGHLSFCGQDTCKTFAGHLHDSLGHAGIRVFWDEGELERGVEINEQLMEAIKQSKISIPVISKNYANSKSCLRELVQMLKCKDEMDHIIIPIFYYISPWNVGNEDLEGLKKRGIDGTLINSWKTALSQIRQLTGYHVDQNSAESDGEVIKQIIDQVQRKLKKKDLIVTKQLVDVAPHVQSIMAKLKVDYHNGQAVKIGDTREMVLIHGLSGVGKTVLAKCIYNQLHHLFDACSFLENIQADIEREGVVSVQNKLISDLHKGNAQKFHGSDGALTHIKYNLCNMKVLVLLDDVKDHVQLTDLVGEPDWFGLGSRVIVTSQRDDLLKNIGGAESFFLRPMKQDEALKLFCRHAFGKDYPRKRLKRLSRDIVTVTGGHPLTLKLVGSHLKSEKNKKVWEETLEALGAAPHESVQGALRRSYTNLKEKERQIFLDIACFFTGKDKRIPSYMWADCDYSPASSIRELQTRSLVEIGEDKELRMHEILKKFGREIVKEENKKPFKRSRLCDHNEALKVLQTRKGTGKVLGLRLEFGDGSKGNISFERHQFDGLRNLRFLKLDRADIRGHFGDCLSSLKWLDWQGCPKSFDVKSLNLNLQNLVILDLSWSQVDKDWRGWKLLLGEAKKLKVLKLTGCVQLSATPKFPLSMKLERLFLEGCSNLAVIHRSFGNLKKLVSLNMKGCRLLRELPDLRLMTGLKELVIDGTSISRIDFQHGSVRKLKILSACDCKNLTEISDSISHLKSLKYLALDGTAIQTLRKSIESLEKLKTLSLKNCERLTHLPEGIGKLTSLQFLNLSYTKIRKLPPSVNKLKALKVLKMGDTFIQEFPEDILNLKELEEIDFSSCRSLEGKIPDDIWRLSSLAILNLSRTQISGLPESLSRLSRLQRLDISRCRILQSRPELPSSLIIIDDN